MTPDNLISVLELLSNPTVHEALERQGYEIDWSAVSNLLKPFTPSPMFVKRQAGV